MQLLASSLGQEVLQEDLQEEELEEEQQQQELEEEQQQQEIEEEQQQQEIEEEVGSESRLEGRRRPLHPVLDHEQQRQMEEWAQILEESVADGQGAHAHVRTQHVPKCVLMGSTALRQS